MSGSDISIGPRSAVGRSPNEPMPDSGTLTGPATLPEVTQLWWFCDGAIMDVGTRQHLWRSWGLCARHAWLHFCAENELKYQPLGNAVLYQDLTTRAAGLVGPHHRARRTAHELAIRDTCLTCDYVVSARISYQRFAADQRSVIAGVRTRMWVAGASQVWTERCCPRCLSSLTSQSGVLCRLHATGEELVSASLRDYLAELAVRLRRCVVSMSADGPGREPDSDAALVEALGWFAGWNGGAHFLTTR